MTSLSSQLTSLLKGETDPIANAANTAAFLFHSFTDINWVGFYFRQNQELVLGPFQGKPACVRIPLGKGVCGAAAASCNTLVVPDVHQFPGHIACDADSKSEIVIPLVREGELWGVLDLDSPRLNRFNDQDRILLEEIAHCYLLSLTKI